MSSIFSSDLNRNVLETKLIFVIKINFNWEFLETHLLVRKYLSKAWQTITFQVIIIILFYFFWLSIFSIQPTTHIPRCVWAISIIQNITHTTRTTLKSNKPYFLLQFEWLCWRVMCVCSMQTKLIPTSTTVGLQFYN